MVSSILLSFFAGLFGANAVPHFVAGWSGLIITALLVYFVLDSKKF